MDDVKDAKDVKVILYMAQSVNGLIARKNHDEDFLSHENWKCFQGLAEKYGCFVIGRKTFDIVSNWKEYTFDDINAVRIVVSKQKHLDLPKRYICAKSPKDALNVAKSSGFKKIILTGGSTINSSFIRQNLVDEMILNIEPYILGSGIGLFSDDDFTKRLILKKIIRLRSGIIQLQYTVKK